MGHGPQVQLPIPFTTGPILGLPTIFDPPIYCTRFPIFTTHTFPSPIYPTSICLRPLHFVKNKSSDIFPTGETNINILKQWTPLMEVSRKTDFLVRMEASYWTSARFSGFGPSQWLRFSGFPYKAIKTVAPQKRRAPPYVMKTANLCFSFPRD